MQAMIAPMMQGVMERVMSRYVPQHHHSMHESEMDSKEMFRKHMAEYWDDVVQGRESASEEMVTGFCMLMMEVLPQCMKSMGYDTANVHHHERESCGNYKAHHMRFKEAMDRLRRAPVQDRNTFLFIFAMLRQSLWRNWDMQMDISTPTIFRDISPIWNLCLRILSERNSMSRPTTSRKRACATVWSRCGLNTTKNKSVLHQNGYPTPKCSANPSFRSH